MMEGDLEGLFSVGICVDDIDSPPAGGPTLNTGRETRAVHCLNAARPRTMFGGRSAARDGTRARGPLVRRSEPILEPEVRSDERKKPRGA